MAKLDTMERAGGAGRPDGQREDAAEPRHPGQAAAQGGAGRGLAAGLAAGGGEAVLYTDLYTVLYTVQVPLPAHLRDHGKLHLGPYLWLALRGHYEFCHFDPDDNFLVMIQGRE